MFDNINLLTRLFDYEPQTGKIIFKHRDFGPNPCARHKQWNTRYAGKQAGYINKSNGYVRVRVSKNKELYAHQIAFAIMIVTIPNEIDHKDLNKTNNKWENIRPSEHSQNVANCRKRKSNKSGFKGVSWAKSNSCWRMDIQYKGVKYFSYHETAEDAYNEYCRMSKKLHGEFGNAK